MLTYLTTRRFLLCMLALALTGACGPKEPPPPNVILISIDTLRSDHLGCYGYTRPTSPVMDSLAASGVLFEHMSTQSSWTLPSHVSLLTSTFPFTHGVVDDNSRIPGDLPIAAELFSSHGYRCGGIVSGFYVGRTFGFERGFDEFEDFGARMFQPMDRRYKILAPTITDWGLDWIGNSREPFFLFLHYFDAHFNYVVPEPYRSMFEEEYPGPEIDYRDYEYYLDHPLTEAEQSHLLAQYDAAIAYVDADIGRLMRSLRDRELDQRTIVVITSDHGEEFFERGSWGHDHTLNQEILEIPLIWVDPRMESRGRRVNHPARLVDVLPTLLDILDLPSPETLQGRSLASLMAGNPPSGSDPLLLAETSRYKVNLASLTRGPVKIIADLANNQQSLYHLESDPGEQIDLSASDTALTQSLLTETTRISGELIPGRLVLRWQGDTPDTRFTGSILTPGAIVAAEYRGEDTAGPATDPDRHGLRFSTGRPGELRLAVVPVDAPVIFELRMNREIPHGRVFVGGNALQPNAESVMFPGVIHSDDLLRPPPDRGPGFYLWKDPGDRSTPPPVTLSEEAKEHLKSLGYLH